MKAGQFVSALRQVPKEYSTTLSSLQDQVGNQTHLIVSFHVICVFLLVCSIILVHCVSGESLSFQRYQRSDCQEFGQRFNSNVSCKVLMILSLIFIWTISGTKKRLISNC